MIAETKTHAGQDSFLETLRSELTSGTGILSSWIVYLQSQDGIDILFEFETWLRGLCSFFDCRHLPLGEEGRREIVSRNFAPEIRIARLALQECERCTLQLSGLGENATVETEALIENQIYRTGVLESQVGKLLHQSTPMDSLARLLGAINDLKVMVDALNDPPRQDFQVFLSLGRIFERELHNCRFIDMLLSQRFRLQYDRVDNPLLSDVLRSIPEEHVRRNVAMGLLHLYRLLRYLKLVSTALRHDRPLRRYLVVLSLLHEQTEALCDFLKSRFLKEHRGGSKLRDAAALIIHSLRMGMQRVFERELTVLGPEKDASALYTGVENSHGLLRNCYQNCVVTLLQAFLEHVDAKALFPELLEGAQQGHKLQKDLWELCLDLRAELERRGGFNLSQVLDRISRFRESSLRYLMYQDWGEFERFSEGMITAANEVEVRVLLRKFIGFLEVLMQEVSKRSLLQ